MGGADTKVTHLLLLLRRHYDITMVPNMREQLLQLRWRRFPKNLGVKAALLEELPLQRKHLVTWEHALMA